MKDNLDDECSTADNSPYFSPLRKSSICFKTVIENRNNKDTVINNNFYYSFLNRDEEDRENNKINATRMLIAEFLDDLNASKKIKDKSLVIEKFKQDFLFGDSKKTKYAFKNEDIYKLFFGDKVLKKNGLIFHAGDIEGNLLGAERCIELLSNLIDYEYNLESEFFINIFRLGKLDNFNQMKLRIHLTSGKPNLFNSCCRLIKIILNEDKNISFETLLVEDDLVKKIINYFLRYDDY